MHAPPTPLSSIWTTEGCHLRLHALRGCTNWFLIDHIPSKRHSQQPLSNPFIETAAMWCVLYVQVSRKCEDIRLLVKINDIQLMFSDKIKAVLTAHCSSVSVTSSDFRAMKPERHTIIHWQQNPRKYNNSQLRSQTCHLHLKHPDNAVMWSFPGSIFLILFWALMPGVECLTNRRCCPAHGVINSDWARCCHWLLDLFSKK